MPVRRRVLAAVLSIATLLMFTMPGIRKIDERILFQPEKYPAGDWTPSGLHFEDVHLESADGTQLHAWFCPCEDARASILFLHGNAGHLAGRAGFLKRLQKQLHVQVLIVDYRGYGRSAGQPTIDGAIADVRAASRRLAALAGVPESELIVWGRSLGGALAVQLAARTQPRGLIIESSFSSLREVAARHFPLLAWIVGRHRLNSAAVIRQYTGALLQSHGTRDEVVPFQSGEKLFAAASEPKVFLKLDNYGHNDSAPVSFFHAVEQLIDRFADTPENPI
ncbi:MAG: alpha/beta hydrolase [Planctomycetaceae bacterium]